MVMKAIICGKRYDTEKAKFIGDVEHSNQGDFRHWYAGLYRTPVSKVYFLAGHGGALSEWAQSDGHGGNTGSSGIKPFLTRQDAMEWAETFLDGDTVEAEFADMIEDA